MVTSRFRKIVVRTVVAVVAIALAVAGFGAIAYYRITRSGLPTTAGALTVQGLAAPVTVRRDTWGVPHIDGSTAGDALFAQGYTCAQDRLWQMDLLRRDASGRLAELVGEVALERDIKHRRLGYRGVCEGALAKLEDGPRTALERYGAGVNAYIATHRDQLPAEFTLLRYEPEPWTPVDSLVIGKLMAETLGTTYERDLMRASFSNLDPQIYNDIFVEVSRDDVPFVGQDVPRPDATTSPAAGKPVRSVWADGYGEGSELLAGSNNWVVSGSKTRSGKPLLANDPHLALALPPIWYALHVHSADGLNVAGVTFPGVPGVTLGHNARIAWGATNFGPDVQDLYVETFDETGRRYKVGGTWVDAEVRTETIRVRSSVLDPSLTDRAIDVVVTRHGPVVKEQDGVRYALRWTALDSASELTAFYGLNRAASWDDFQTALSTYPGPMQNFVYADVDGNIGYTAAGNVPIRRVGTGDKPYDGATDAGDWIGFIPFERLPRVFNPGTGFIATANNRVLGSSVTEFYTHEWISPYRANRISTLLADRTGLTPEDMNTIQNDVYSRPDDVFAREVSALASQHNDDAEWGELKRHADSFDGRLELDSVDAAVIAETRKAFCSRVLKAGLGAPAVDYAWFSRETFYTNLIQDRPARWLPTGAQSWDQVVIDAYREAMASLKSNYGADPASWRYGRLNQFQLAHPLGRNGGPGAIFNLPAFEVAGGPSAIKAIGVMRGWGPSMRLVADLSDFDNTTLVLPAGESGQPASTHYSDQTDDWRLGRTHPFPFSDAAVRASTIETLELAPAS